MLVDILGTNWDQCRSMVQYGFMSTETIRLIRMDSPGQPPRLSHSFRTMLCFFHSLSFFYTECVLSRLYVDVQISLLVTLPVVLQESDYFTPQGEFRVDAAGSQTLLNCLMYKLSYYRFGQMQVCTAHLMPAWAQSYVCWVREKSRERNWLVGLQASRLAKESVGKLAKEWLG